MKTQRGRRRRLPYSGTMTRNGTARSSDQSRNVAYLVPMGDHMKARAVSKRHAGLKGIMYVPILRVDALNPHGHKLWR